VRAFRGGFVRERVVDKSRTCCLGLLLFHRSRTSVWHESTTTSRRRARSCP
jgi:hypothetical protein